MCSLKNKQKIDEHIAIGNWLGSHIRQTSRVVNHKKDYTITWVDFCVQFNWLLKDTHRWHQIHVRSRQIFFSCPQNSSMNNLNFYCIKQIDYIDYKMITHFTTLLHHLKIRFCIRFPSGALNFFRVKI